VSNPEPLNWDEVVEKLASIKALADRGGTLAEAETASAMMAKLLLRYNLSMMELEQHVAEQGRTVTHQDMHTSSAGWRWRLLMAVAWGHLCEAIYVPGTGKCTVVGHAHNLIVVREMYLWLLDEINRCCETEHQKARASGDGSAEERPRAWRVAFRLGAAFAIRDAYQRMLREAQQDVSPAAWALVPVMSADVSALVRKLFSTVHQAADPHPDHPALAAGYRAGSQIGLHRQVRDQEPSAVLS